jgi:hypothetical protein
MKSHLPNREYVLLILFTPILYFIPVFQDGNQIMGAPISDVWNGWWSMLYGVGILKGELGVCSEAFNHPVGGCIVPADWTSVFWMLPLSVISSSVHRFNITLYAQVCLIGLGMFMVHHQWFNSVQENEFKKNEPKKEDAQRGAFWCSVLLQWSTVVVTGLHNGSTEVLSLGWVLLGLYGWGVILQDRKIGWLFVVPVVFTSWYGVVGFFLFALIYWWHLGFKSWRSQLFPLGAVLSLWGGFVAWVLQHTRGQGNVVRIKGSAEMESVRRTIGSADPFSFLVPWEYTSPDFAEVSRFGEQFIHSSYIGWVVLLTCVLAWKTIRQRAIWLVYVGLIGFLLSLGPVLIVGSEPVVFFDKWGVPLPYFVLEHLPLFDHLTLLYRLSWIPIVVCTALATHYWSRTFKRMGWVLFGLACIEMHWLSPVRNAPYCSQVGWYQSMSTLEDFPTGGVGFYPLAGGRPYMITSMLHRNPIASTLNYSANGASLAVLSVMRDVEAESDVVFVNSVRKIAKRRGIRYWIVSSDSSAMPDSFFKGMYRSVELFPLIVEYSASVEPSVCGTVWSEVKIVQLW